MSFNCRPFASRTASRALAFLAVASFAVKPSPVAATPVAAVPGSIMRLPFPSARIKYHMTSSGMGSMSSNMTWTWANGGELFRQDLQGHLSGGLSGQDVNTNSWTFTDGKALYTAMTGEMLSQPAGRKVVLRTMLPRDYFKRLMEMGTRLTPSNQSRVIGHSTILGKPCEIRAVDSNSRASITHNKVWVWKNLPLRMESTTTMKAGGKSYISKTTSIATQLDTNFKPSPSLFRVPAGYKVETMQQFEKEMQKMQNP